ncbi:MAG: hypothetical protein JXR60_11195 [Bacteroidales bacterium]|nr:hypothetical protein [Bacteroidales bacterium]
MKLNLFIISIILVLTNSCSVNPKAEEVLQIEGDLSSSDQSMSIELNKGKHFNHPSFVIWLEDMSENYLKTIYITPSFASGSF